MGIKTKNEFTSEDRRRESIRWVHHLSRRILPELRASEVDLCCVEWWIANPEPFRLIHQRDSQRSRWFFRWSILSVSNGQIERFGVHQPDVPKRYLFFFFLAPKHFRIASVCDDEYRVPYYMIWCAHVGEIWNVVVVVVLQRRLFLAWSRLCRKSRTSFALLMLGF